MGVATDVLRPLDATLLDRASREPDRPLIATPAHTAPVTAAGLAAAAGHAARWLAEHDVGDGDRIAVWGQNSDAWATWLCAAAWRGAAIVALHPALEAPDLADALRRSSAHWLVADETARGRLIGETARSVHDTLRTEGGANLRGVSVVPGGDGRLDLAALTAGGGPAPPPAGRLDRPLNLQFTSGSTGRPKAVVLSQRALVLNALRTARAAGIDGRDIVASPLPLYHAAGLSSGLVLCLATGAHWCTSHRFDPDAALDQVADREATVFQGVPTMFRGLIEAAARRRQAVRSLRLGFIGGAPCPPALCRAAIDALGLARMAIVYGQTEFGPTISLTRGDEPGDLALTSVGPPIDGTALRLVDPATGREAATGEIQVRGRTVMDGYFGDPEATSAAIAADGWLRTGDIGTRDRGCLKVVGRLREMIIRGGENVAPAELEEVLCAAPGVADAVVVGVPSEHWGEEICAVILGAPGAGPDPVEISTYCATRLARYKRPDRYVLRDALPSLPSGKVDRAAVRQAVVSGAWRSAPTRGAA